MILLRTARKDFAVVTVFLVDDHEVVRRGLADLLASDPEIEVIGDAGFWPAPAATS